MAVQVAYQHPLDLNKRVAVGVSIPFNGLIAFNPTYTTTEQIKSNLINFILTNKGERVLNPNFGSDLRRFIFENITESNLRALEIKLINDIKTNFSSINVISITLTSAYETNAIQLDIVYSIYSSEAQNITIIF
jgi:phage baseplate assembly protein W